MFNHGTIQSNIKGNRTNSINAGLGHDFIYLFIYFIYVQMMLSYPSWNESRACEV